MQVANVIGEDKDLPTNVSFPPAQVKEFMKSINKKHQQNKKREIF